MHSFRKDLGLFLLLLIAVFITVAAGPIIAHLTAVCLRQELANPWQDVVAMAGFMRVAAPRLAVVLTDALIMGGALLLMFSLSLIVAVPWGIFSLHRRIDSLQSELYALRLQLAATSATGKSHKNVSVSGPLEDVALNPSRPEPISELTGKLRSYDQ